MPVKGSRKAKVARASGFENIMVSPVMRIHESSQFVVHSS
jgi:hypothetical protein